MSLFWSPAYMAAFAKVVELNGFSAAARALGVPKAAVSRAVAGLEDELGARLLERTTRRLSLTPAGRLLLPHCQAVAASTDSLRSAAAPVGGGRKGPLRVVAEPAFGRVLLAPLVPRFLEKFPEMPLDVSMEADLAALDPADWDVAVQVGESAIAGQTSRVLGAPPTVLVATSAYLAAHGEPARPDELAKHALLTPATRDAQYRLTLSKASRREEVLCTPKLAVNDPALLHSAAAAGLGIGLVPEFLCRQGIATRKLTRVLSGWSLPAAPPLCAVYPARLAEDRRVKAWVDFLAANVVPALAGG